MNEVVVEQNVSVVDVSCVEEVEAGLLEESVVCVTPGMFDESDGCPCLLLVSVESKCNMLERCMSGVLVERSGECELCRGCVLVGGGCNVCQCESVVWGCRWSAYQW